MHLNDARDGTDVAKGVLEKYKAALEDKGMISQDDLYMDSVVLKQDQCVAAKNVGFTAW